MDYEHPKLKPSYYLHLRPSKEALTYDVERGSYMDSNILLSSCCGYEVFVTPAKPDDKMTTNWYVCSYCHKPCDLKDENERSNEIGEAGETGR